MKRIATLRRVNTYRVPLIVTICIALRSFLRVVTRFGCLMIPRVMPHHHRGMRITRYASVGVAAFALRFFDAARYAVPSNATPFCFAFHAAVTNAI